MKPNVLKWSRVVAFVVLSNYLVSSMYAQDSIGPAVSTRGSYLFGDWSGERTKLENAGVVFNLIYVDDVLTDMRGDMPNWSRVRGTLDIDFGKAELIRGLKFHIAAMWQAGGVLAIYIGTIANPSSNASFDLMRLDSWWFEQSLAHDKVFLREIGRASCRERVLMPV